MNLNEYGIIAPLQRAQVKEPMVPLSQSSANPLNPPTGLHIKEFASQLAVQLLLCSADGAVFRSL